MFKDIPKNTKRIYCDRWGCSPECCALNQIIILAHYTKEDGGLGCFTLWESEFFHTDEPDYYLDEINEAFQHYGLEIPESIWYYDEVERIL